jgi:hypothetical protein
MKKRVLFLVFAMIFTMIVPAQAMEQPQNIMPDMTLLDDDVNGNYVVSVKSGDKWNEIGSLKFGKNQSKQTLNIGCYLTGDGIIVKLSQDGGGAAYLDAVLLDNAPSVDVIDNTEKILNKLSKEDLDITPVGEEGVVLKFDKGISSVLTVVGRIEPVVIGKEPLQFPSENNYKSKDKIEDFYSYTLGSNIGTIKVDGVLDEVKNLEPFVKEFRVPGSGHPAGDTYFWVMNDNENLYVNIDVTPDNTFDGNKDYAKVYIKIDDNIKEFKVSVPETLYGNTNFTYTDKVVYEHKVYEFAIPLCEMDNNKKDISLAFVVYGTASMPTDFYTPDLAYDADDDVYVCVYEGANDYSNYIYADIINSDGTVINEYPIMISGWQYSYNPSIAYDFLNDSFMVVWCQGDSNTEIYGRLFDLKKDNDDEDFYIHFKDDEFQITNNEDIESEPDIAFNRNYEDGVYNGHYLVVWSQRINDNSEDSDIYGRFVNSDGILIDEKGFAICNVTGNQSEPTLSYSFRSELFMLAWINENSEGCSVNARVINEDGTLGKSINPIIGNVKNPNIAINERNDFFLLTWVQDNQIKGAYCYFHYDDNAIKFLDTYTLSSSGYVNEYPVSVFGKNNMLSIWNALQIDSDDDSYAKLSYWDIYEPIDEVFETESPELTNYDSSNKSIDVASNFLNNKTGYENYIIAYIPKGRQDISYRVVGETPEFQPYIEFDSDEYNIDLNISNSIQSEVFHFESEDQEEGYLITDDEFIHYISNDESVATISDTGLITGLTNGTTTIEAVYYEPQYYLMSNDGESELPYGALTAIATVTVTKTEPKEPSLTFIPNKIEKYVGDKFSVKINYNDGISSTSQNVTNLVEITLDNPNIATTYSAINGEFICTAIGETTLRTTYAGISASATLKVEKRATPPPSSGGSSGSVKTPIGQILVDKKVIEDIYEEDLIAKNNIYTFTADKSGKSAKLWLDSKYYKNLAEDYPNRIIQFNWDNGTYTLPLNCAEVLKEIDNSAKKVNILIEDVDDNKTVSSANKSAENIGAEIISDLIDFCVFVEKSNQNIEINSYNFYAVRTINKLDEISENISTAMKFVEDKESLTFSPSVFDDNYATIKYRGNGIFTIIENPQTFSDISSHWAKLNIEKLATRNIAFGRENNGFAPDDFVTRAEFAVMITRALGITEEEGSNDFTDVSNEWFAEDISTAFSSGLINGRNDGKFYPNEKIQRKDMAVMIHNALKFIGLNTDASNADSVLSMFNDSNKIADYAREGTAVCAEAEIILGRDTGNFDPNDNATRAESSAIIERMLRFVKFMD